MRHSIALLLILLACPLSAADACEGTCIQQFPSDSGILNVRDFGAKGDGRSDDTAQFVAAIAAAVTIRARFSGAPGRFILPSGTYWVSRSLVKRYSDGRYGSGMILVGQSETSTIIKLTDNAPGFGNANAPRGVIMTTAKLLDGSPTSQ